MRKMKTGKRPATKGLVLTLALLAATGCATTIKTSVLMPGRVDQAAQFKSIAVLPFDGEGGRALTSLVESTLAGVIIDEKQYFQIVDRGSMDKAMSELKLSMTGMVDSNAAAQVGKMVGARGIYTGVVNMSSVDDNRFSETRKKCSYTVTKTDSKGRKYEECAKYHETSVNCTKRTAAFAFTPKLIEVESSRLIFSNSYEGKTDDSQCEDSGHALSDRQEMKKRAQDEALQRFRMDVAPYYTTVSFTLKDSTSGMDSSNAKAKLKNGMAFAKNNRMDRACELWKEAKASAPNAVSLLFNLGVCAEMQARPEEAQVLYQQIDRMLIKPDELVSKALARVNEQIEKRKKLGQQMAR